MSLPLRIFLKAIVNAALMWVLAQQLPQFITILGGVPAYLILGALIAALNSFIKPVLDLLSIPLKLFTTLLAVILVNAAVLYLVYRATLFVDPTLLTLVINGGVIGWIVISLIVGTANWVMKLVIG